MDVAPNFLPTVGIPLLSGRDLTLSDNLKASKVAIVSQSLAQRYFPNQNPLGLHIITGDDQEVEIVGVARDAKVGNLRSPSFGQRILYLPYLQRQPGPSGDMSFIIRTVGNPIATVAAIRQAVRSIDRTLLLFDVITQNELITREFAKERLLATLLSFFGLLALTLVCAGLYGVMSYTVAQRTHEIGVRMSLGAQRGAILWMVLRESLLLVLTGSMIGLLTALAVGHLITKMLYRVSPTDPLTVAPIILSLLIIAMLASWLPARRASRVDPMIALRCE
jgi:predicted permease